MRTWVRLGWPIGSASCHSCFLILFKMEEDHLYALRWKELEMHSLALQNTLHKRTWSDEKNLLQQELRSLKQNIFLFYVKLRWLLKHWRQGKQMEEGGEDFTEVGPPARAARLICICFILDTPTSLSHPLCPPVVTYLLLSIQAMETVSYPDMHENEQVLYLDVALRALRSLIPLWNGFCSHPLGCGWI